MARIDYYEIEERIAEHLRIQEDLQDVNVLVEQEVVPERRPLVMIHLDRRDLADEQPLAAGQRTRYILRFSIWCYQFALVLKDAQKLRDDLMGKVEIALMKNRSINDIVSYSWLEGGEFESGPTEGVTGFLSGGEIILRSEVTATT